MINEINVNWFKKEIEPFLTNCDFVHKQFKDGDFGELNQIEINSSKIGIQIDFWGLGWLGIFIINYDSKSEILNILLEPQELDSQYNYLQELKKNLKMYNCIS